ncbi:MAG: hypothetical protein PHQ95_03750 [Candidatus Gracilibacteria bacterium]|nr:hypothetical protein [Candidatus Gracilibacteria bacterium]
MRSHGKHIEKTPGLGEMFALIDEHQELEQAERTSKAIQQILNL